MPWTKKITLRGVPGAGLSIQGTQAGATISFMGGSYGLADVGKAWIMSADGTVMGSAFSAGHLLVWDGTAFTDAGMFAGTAGAAGSPGRDSTVQGPRGPAGVTSAMVLGGAAGSAPKVAVSGAGMLILTLPKGDKGDPGQQGPAGVLSVDARNGTSSRGSATLSRGVLSIRFPRASSGSSGSYLPLSGGTMRGSILGSSRVDIGARRTPIGTIFVHGGVAAGTWHGGNVVSDNSVQAGTYLRCGTALYLGATGSVPTASRSAFSVVKSGSSVEIRAITAKMLLGTAIINHLYSTAGTVGAHAFSLSDPKMKRGVEHSGDHLHKVKVVNPIKFNYDSDPEGAPHRYGFDAAELETQFPDSMMTRRYDAENEAPGEDFLPHDTLLMDSSQVTAVLWRAVQELTEKVETLEGAGV